MVDMIEDDDDMPGVTLGEPFYKYGGPNLEDCTIRNDDPRYAHCKFSIPEQITVILSDDSVGLLKELSTSQGITPTEALRKAIATEGYLYEQRKKGATVLLLTPGEGVREVLFR